STLLRFIYEGTAQSGPTGTDGHHHLARSTAGRDAREVRVRMGPAARGTGRREELALAARRRCDRAHSARIRAEMREKGSALLAVQCALGDGAPFVFRIRVTRSTRSRVSACTGSRFD